MELESKKLVFQVQKAVNESEQSFEKTSCSSSEKVSSINSFLKKKKKSLKDFEYQIGKHPYKKRKSKLELSGKNYLCDICYKCYLSYAACYMHLIKKHHMNASELKYRISISKFNLAKRKKLTTKEILQSLLETEKIKNFERYEEIFKLSFHDVFHANISKYSQFYENRYPDFILHPLYSKIKKFHAECQPKKFNCKDQVIQSIRTVDDSLAVFYLGSSNFLTYSETVTLMKNILLFREGVNFLGLELIEIFKSYKIISEKEFKGEFCSQLTPEDVPPVSDDYLCHFLNFGSHFPLKLSSTATFVMDYCNFLFESDLSNYRVEPLLDNKLTDDTD